MKCKHLNHNALKNVNNKKLQKINKGSITTFRNRPKKMKQFINNMIYNLFHNNSQVLNFKGEIV